MTGPSSGDRPAEETCVPLGNDAHAHVSPDAPPELLSALDRLADAARQDFVTPPAVRTGDETQSCTCPPGFGDHYDGCPLAPPVSGTATRDDDPINLAAEAKRVADLYHSADREDLEDGIYASLVNLSELLALGGSQPAQPAEEQRPDDADTGQGDDGLRQRMIDLAAQLEYYASKTYGGTWQDGANEAAARIRKVLGADL